MNRAKKHIITLGGLPGSGKSTVKKILAQRLGYTSFSTGDFVRRLAIESGQTLDKFDEQTLHSTALDEKIDAELKRIEANEDCVVVDSHLACHFIPSGFSVFLDITPEVSADRIFKDSTSELRQKSGEVMSSIEEARERTEHRIQNHIKRYEKYCGINPYHPDNHDFVVNAVHNAPEEVANIVQTAYEHWLADDKS